MVWSKIQQWYYSWIGYRQSGWRWAAALIKKMWDGAWEQWEHRNMVLHDELDKELWGKDLTLNIKLMWEFKIGPMDLPHWMAFLFHMNLEDLLQMSQEYRRSWPMNVEVGHKGVARCWEIN